MIEGQIHKPSNDSPFLIDDTWLSNGRTVPPRRNIAPVNEHCVRVDGSKNIWDKILP